jgi:glucose-1-phosphate adenylyltransferase
MRDVIAMVLAGGRVEELSVLTLQRPKAAVPFGGQYRIIDFSLSSLVHAEIERIGVVSLYRPSSLIDHIGTGEPWDLMGRGRGIKILPPYKSGEEDSHWYQGTADAVFQNLFFIRNQSPRDVLVVSGDHICGVDFRAMLQKHRESGADLTIAVKPMEPEVGRGRFGFAEVDNQGKVTGYEEKPEQPRSNLASLTMYLFRTEALIRHLEENRLIGTTHQLYDEVLPRMVDKDRVFSYCYKGYWNYSRSVDAYHQANMDLLGDEPLIRLDRWGIRSRPYMKGLGDLPPTRIDRGATCIDSVVSPGVWISGSVTRSVLSPGVRIQAGASVSDSVLMHNVVVSAGARLDRVVADKMVIIGAGASIGCGEVTVPNAEVPNALASGITVIGKAAQVPANTRVGRNCALYPNTDQSDWHGTWLENGTCLHPTQG